MPPRRRAMPTFPGSTSTPGESSTCCAARWSSPPGPHSPPRQNLALWRGALALPPPTTPGAAPEHNTTSPRLNSTYGKGRGTLNGKVMTGDDLEARMGTDRNPDELREM